MAIFDNFPYTNIHDLNTDWLVKIVKEVKNKTDLIDQAVLDAENYANISEENKNIIEGLFITPEMYGAVGDGLTDDTTAFQNAVNACQDINGLLKLKPGKNYKLTDTIESTKRWCLDGSGATVTSTASWAFHIDSDGLWPGEFTVLQNLYLICTNGVKIESIRTLLLNSRIQNTGTAIQALPGSYETIVDNCYLVSFTGQTSIGLDVQSSDLFFNNITGYGQKIFIKNNSSSTFVNIHGWPIDGDYTDSIFFYETSAGFDATLLNCHSDTYQYAIRSTQAMNHLYSNIKNFTCNWAGKPEGWLFYSESTLISTWAFMRADVTLNTLPVTFHVCNLPGVFCLNNYNFKLNLTDVEKGANCYCDDRTIMTSNTTLNVYLYGSVNTAQRTDLELYIPYCRYFGDFSNIVVYIEGVAKRGQIVKWDATLGRLKVQCSQFTANSGYQQYMICFSRELSFTQNLTN